MKKYLALLGLLILSMIMPPSRATSVELAGGLSCDINIDENGTVSGVCRPSDPTPSPTSTPVPEPTSTPAPTSTLEPDPDHDTGLCHSAMDGHTHGMCPGSLPPGELRNFVLSNSLFAGIGHPWLSSDTENIYPFPSGGHEGFVNLHKTYDGCEQFVNTGDVDALCVREVYFQVHSLRIAEEIRKPPLNKHSQKFVVEVCDQETFSDCGIVAGGQVTTYGEVWTEYKKTACDIPGNIVYPDPYHIEQPPYINGGRNRAGDPVAFQWSSLTNALMSNVYAGLGHERPNRLLQSNFQETIYEGTHIDPDLCALPENDVVVCPGSDFGCNPALFKLNTFKLDISNYPRPFIGFTDRDGNHDPDCNEAGENCIPLFIEATVPPGDVFLNFAVQPGNTEFIDYNEPGLTMP